MPDHFISRRVNAFVGDRLYVNSFATSSTAYTLFVSGTSAFTSDLTITGSFTVFTGSAVEFQVTNTGVKIGSAITDTHTTTGSLSISGSITATSFTGSLQGTASWATNAVTSYTPISVSGSSIYSTSPATSNFNGSNGIFLGSNAGGGAINANLSVFLGWKAGEGATTGNESVMIGPLAGGGAAKANDSVIIGPGAGQYAVSASLSTLIGYYAGARANLTPQTSIGSNNIIIGTNITLPDNTKDSINLGAIIFATGSYSTVGVEPYSGSVNGRVGINKITPIYTLDVSGSGNYTNGLTVTSSLSLISGSLTATSILLPHSVTNTNSTNAGGTLFIYSQYSTSSFVDRGLTISSAPNAFYDSRVDTIRGRADYFAGLRVYGVGETGSAAQPLWLLGQHPIYGVGSSYRYALVAYDGTTYNDVINVSPSTFNVQIAGRTDSGYKLDVNGSFRVLDGGTTPIRIQQSATGNQAITWRLGNTEYGSIGVDTGGGRMAISSSYITTIGVAGNEAIRVSTAGAVAIGSTTTGIHKLEVNGSIGNSLSNRNYYLNASAGGAGLTAASPAYTFYSETGSGMWMPSAGNIAFSTTGSERMRLDSSGNLSINKTTANAKLDISGSTIITGSLTVTQGITGSLFGTSSWAVSASWAPGGGGVSGGTKDYVTVWASTTTLTTGSIFDNGSVGIGTTSPNAKLEVKGTALISSSLTIGTSSLGANENTLVLGPAPAGGAGEGGQILLQAPGGTYTSASMWDNYQNYTRLLRGTNASSDAVVAQFNMHTKQVTFPQYNTSTAFVGTATAFLAVDNSGNIITTTGSGASGVSGGSTNYVARWASSIALTTGSLYDSASRVGIGTITPSYTLDVSGDIRSTGAVYANANGAMYFRGGDDAEFWDINVANTVGIYGQQDQGLAAIKLGSGGGTISGRSGSVIVDGGGLIVSGTLATSGSSSKGLIAPLKFTTAPSSTNYTLVYTDEGKMVEMNNIADAPLTVTIPANSSVPFPIGTEISIIQIGAGTTVITGSAGVTVNSSLGLKTLSNTYDVASVVKRGTDSWYLFGNLS